MKRNLGSTFRGLTWLLVMALFIVALSVVLLASTAPVTASLSESPHQARLAESSGSNPSPSSTVLGQMRASSTYTSLLPIVLRGFQPSVDAPFGVESWNANDPILDRMRAMDNRWVRLRLYWSEIEIVNTLPQYYNWPPELDQKLARLAANDIQVILTVMGNPSWAATYPAGPIDLADVSDLAEFMGAAVARYGARPYNVKHWEFYNEPDNGDDFYAGTGGWGYFGNTPQAYVDILSAVYGPMKAADPDAQIVFGGIAYDNWTETGGPFVKTFVDDVLQLGGGDYFDVMNFHYYPAFHANWDPYGMGIIGKTAYLRDELDDYGLDKPFICTEASMWSDAAHGGSDELQSRYVAQVFARTLAADLDATIWFLLVDDSSLGTTKYGLLNPDHTPKPAFDAYQTATRQLGRASYVQTLDVAPIEAYDFLTLDGQTRIVVAWTNDGSTQQLALVAGQAIRVDKYGNQAVISDGDDGVVDGIVHVNVVASPVYVRLAVAGP